MEDYKVLVRFRIHHEYFESEMDGIMDVRIFPVSLILLKNRQLIFKRESRNQWIILGNMEGAGVDDDYDVVWMDFVLKDAVFLYYTEWKGYDSRECYLLDLSGREGNIKVADEVQTMTEKKGGAFFTGKLRLTMDMYRRAGQGQPYEVNLKFDTREVFWEYLLVPRKGENQLRRLLMEEREGKLLFSEPDLVEVDFMKQPVYRTVSCTRIKMKECYGLRLDLWEVLQKDPERKRKILKNVEYPVPGRFYDLKENYLRQIVYF